MQGFLEIGLWARNWGKFQFFVMGGGLKLHSDMDMDVLIWQCHVLEPLKFL